MLKNPFKIYTDPKLRVYRQLGMSFCTGDGGPEEEKGDYIVKDNLHGTWDVAKRAVRMPLGKPG